MKKCKACGQPYVTLIKERKVLVHKTIPKNKHEVEPEDASPF